MARPTNLRAIACYYCRKFQASATRLNNGDLRLCQYTNRQTDADNRAPNCEGFDLYPYIWCEHRHKKYFYAVCASCSGCSTGDFVREYERLHPVERFKPSPLSTAALARLSKIDEDGTFTPVVPIGTRKPRALLVAPANGSAKGVKVAPAPATNKPSKKPAPAPVTPTAPPPKRQLLVSRTPRQPEGGTP